MCLTRFWSPVLFIQLPSTNWDSRSKADQGKHSGDRGVCLNLSTRHVQSTEEHSSSDPVIASLPDGPMSRLKCTSQEAV